MRTRTLLTNLYGHDLTMTGRSNVRLYHTSITILSVCFASPQCKGGGISLEELGDLWILWRRKLVGVMRAIQ
jgi:hypothetical protein